MFIFLREGAIFILGRCCLVQTQPDQEETSGGWFDLHKLRSNEYESSYLQKYVVVVVVNGQAKLG